MHTQTAGLLAERLQAWKHAVGYLEDYMGTMEKIHGRQAKEYERALKVGPLSTLVFRPICAVRANLDLDN